MSSRMDVDDGVAKRPLDQVTPDDEGSSSKKAKLSDPAEVANAPMPSSIDQAIHLDTPPPIPPQGTAPTKSNDGGVSLTTDVLDNPLPMPISRLGLKPAIQELPPSLELVTGVKSDIRARRGFVSQDDVGIIGYAGPKDVEGVRGVIKQRFTDFMVREITLSGEVMYLKDITMPKEPELDIPKDKGKEKAQDIVEGTEGIPSGTDDFKDLPENLQFEPHPKWSTSTTKALRPHISDETIVSLHALLSEGREPPLKSDGGWAARPIKAEGTGTEEEQAMNLTEGASAVGPSESGSGRGRGQGRDRGRGRGGAGGRGGRGGQGGGGGGGDKWWLANGDDREVVSQPIVEKEKRGEAHKAIREALGGIFESTARDIPNEEGQRLVIKWGRGGNRKVQDAKHQAQKKLPPYIHFTLHKSNRETQDALGHLTRLLGIYQKDLSVCGTKDKRAVTVQKVCLKRGNKTLSSVWKSLNGIKAGRRNEKQALRSRGDRGVRVGDFSYSKDYLELGMLKGNHFLITLRNVQTEKEEDIDKILTSLRDHGFINFYGMQRFGSSTVPTHVTGLHLLRGQWAQAVDSILCLREGEHPECVAARLAWLEDQDVAKALSLMPRRAVAERSILEYWSRGNPTTDRLGAMISIPRNLRVMYAHAYQSYIWNLVTSERIKLSSTEPLVGDLVYVNPTGGEDEEDEGDVKGKRSWKTSSSAEVKQLTDADLKDHTIFDVVMPLPGWNVDYPGGHIGELYAKMLIADGLNPEKMRREQREYSLPGSYRKIIHRPTSVSWRHIRYTDPDLGLTQSDEDKILGENPIELSEDGKFRALQIEFELSSSVYATMALREVTREETSTWHQIGLTLRGEDREFRGAKDVEQDGEGEGETVGVEMEGNE